MNRSLTHLERLESEAIYIIREVASEFSNPVMLYSIGKDSTVLLKLALKAFAPARLPFPLLHVDTGWKFREMISFREAVANKFGVNLIVHQNQEGLRSNVNPFTHGSDVYTYNMKTLALRQAMDLYGFDGAIGGARRDEEQSRSKERIFSFRNNDHCWDPRNQRPELWGIYNTQINPGESMRIFPLSNWTEIDVWHYILEEKLDVVPLYLAKPRPVVLREGRLIVVDDERMPLMDGEVPQLKSVRFRSLGCYPLTAAIESNASTIESVVGEMLTVRTSERFGRLLDYDQAASMERKKREGYF